MTQPHEPADVPETTVHDDDVRMRLLLQVSKDHLGVRVVARRHEVEPHEVVGRLVLAHLAERFLVSQLAHLDQLIVAVARLALATNSVVIFGIFIL